MREYVEQNRKSFKPQRGKFTLSIPTKSFILLESFKPQRGKFTRFRSYGHGGCFRVSNPNGVNLHSPPLYISAINKGFKPQRGKFTRLMFSIEMIGKWIVSNPNGVNLHHSEIELTSLFREFQTPTG